MTDFRFDDCIYSKRLERQCAEQGSIVARRLPTGLTGKRDREILTALIESGSILVTEDRSIAEENAELLSSGHPGLVIIANAPRVLPTLTDSLVRSILGTFKARFPSWHSVSVRNSVIEITQDAAFVWHAAQGQLLHDAYILFTSPGFADELERVLRRNTRQVGGGQLEGGT